MARLLKITKTYFRITFCLFCSWTLIYLVAALIQSAIYGSVHESLSVYGVFFMVCTAGAFSFISGIILTIPTEIWKLDYKNYLAYGAVFSFLAILLALSDGIRPLMNEGLFSSTFLNAVLLPAFGTMAAVYVVFMIVYRLFIKRVVKYTAYDKGEVLDVGLDERE